MESTPATPVRRPSRSTESHTDKPSKKYRRDKFMNLTLFEVKEPINKDLQSPFLHYNVNNNSFLTTCVSPRTSGKLEATEEALDDWFAQSQNRKIENMLLAKKEYYVPPTMMDGLKQRWTQKPRRFYIKTAELREGQDRRYFPLYHEDVRLSPRNILNEPEKLLFENQRLYPKVVEGGTALTIKLPSEHANRNTIMIRDNNFEIRMKTATTENSEVVDRRGTLFNQTKVENFQDKNASGIKFFQSGMNLLRDDPQFIKENDSFLSRIREKLSYTHQAQEDLKSYLEKSEAQQYQGSLHEQKSMFQRNIFHKLEKIVENNKNELSSYGRRGEHKEPFSGVKNYIREQHSKIPLLVESNLRKMHPACMVSKSPDNKIEHLMGKTMNHMHAKTTVSTPMRANTSSPIRDGRTLNSTFYKSETPGKSRSPNVKEFSPLGSTKSSLKKKTKKLDNQRVNRKVLDTVNSMDPTILTNEKHNSKNHAHDFSSLKLHVESKQSEETNNLDFWFVRGTMQMNKGNLYNAIDCFKQILLINPKKFICIFNIGCMYERLENYEAAKKWLKLSYEMNFSINESLYGLALCSFKSNKLEDAYKYLAEIENSLADLEASHHYLIALCCKELKRFDKATDHYFKIHTIIEQQLSKEMAHTLMCACFFKAKNLYFEIEPIKAKKFVQFAKQFYMKKNDKLILNSFYVKGDGWKPDSVEEVVSKMQKLNLWKRYPVEYLRNFLYFIDYEIINEKKILFPSEEYVYVIVSGTIAIKDHSNDFLKPKIVAYLEQGSVIGLDEIDGYNNRKSENWLVCLSDVEAFKIKKFDFTKMWEAQKTIKKIINYDTVREISLFKGVTDQTLFHLCYENALTETFSKGDILFNDNSYITSTHLQNMLEKKYQNYSMYKFKRKGSGEFDELNKSNENSPMEKKSKHKHDEQIQIKSVNRPGIMIILSGECQVEDSDKTIYASIMRGDFFGESMVGNIKSYNSFGLIRAKTDNVEVLLISKYGLSTIPYYDIDTMENNCKDRRNIKQIESIVDNRKKKK